MKYKTIKKYIQSQFEKEGFEISDEALNQIYNLIQEFIEDWAKNAHEHGNHKTLMEDDLITGLIFIDAISLEDAVNHDFSKVHLYFRRK